MSSRLNGTLVLKYRENKRNIWYNQEKKINLQTNGTSCIFCWECQMFNV